MKTITIQIQVPDGVEVRVGQQGGNEQAFTPRPDPPKPMGVCPEHGTDWKLVPAGYSEKKKKSYNSFWACSTQGCNIKPGDDQLPF